MEIWGNPMGTSADTSLLSTVALVIGMYDTYPDPVIWLHVSDSCAVAYVLNATPIAYCF